MAILSDTVVNGHLMVSGSLIPSSVLPVTSGGTGSTSFPGNALIMVNSGGASIGYASLSGGKYSIDTTRATTVNTCDGPAKYFKDYGNTARIITFKSNESPGSVTSIAGFRRSDASASSVHIKDMAVSRLHFGDVDMIQGQHLSVGNGVGTSNSVIYLM